MTNNFTPYGVLTADELAFMDAQRWAHVLAARDDNDRVVTYERGIYWVRETPAPGANVVYTTKGD